MITDTLHHVALIRAQTAPPSNSNLEVIYYVNSFYEQAWNKLIWVVGSLFVILAGVLPLVIQIYQNWKIKADKKELTNEITLAVKNAKDEINIAIAAKTEALETASIQLEKKIEELDRRAEDLNNQLVGRTLVLQGNSQKEKNPNSAFYSYLKALKAFSKCLNQDDSKVLIKSILRLKLLKDKKSLNELYLSRKTSFEQVIADILANDSAIVLRIEVDKIIKMVNSLPEDLSNTIE